MAFEANQETAEWCSMTCSNGDNAVARNFYRNLEAKLGIAQRAKQKSA
ncbi:MAG: hypothetical protein WBM66_13040 [Thiothrix litoralis]|jgi:hypothetical protein|nr:hypothetical protein [Thiothrix litoralis]